MTLGTPTYFPAGPIDIRDGAMTRLSSSGAFHRVFPFRTLPTKPEHLPAACVYHGGDRTEPWGDANVGVPSFDHTLTLAIDVIAEAPSEIALDSTTVPLAEGVKATLLTDPTWLALFEACSRIDTRYSYPKEGDTFLCVATIEFELSFRSEWSPILEHDLLEIVAVIPDVPSGPVLSLTYPESDP